MPPTVQVYELGYVLLNSFWVCLSLWALVDWLIDLRVARMTEGISANQKRIAWAAVLIECAFLMIYAGFVAIGLFAMRRLPRPVPLEQLVITNAVFYLPSLWMMLCTLFARWLRVQLGKEEEKTAAAVEGGE